MKTFIVIDDTDGSNVLGGSVGLDNAHLLRSVLVEGNKMLDQMEVGESQLRKFFASGTNAVYRVRRVS